ncbi:phosphoglycerate mutase [Aulographum hederae CBS 113979]|uniref:Phosphoglycerate mutase n=1 Tax=Aulographum hederae CBS 113979 TaxID=1176131 RepID=A0A6G1HDZ4_9PEZI|nr:phosphoglycerate mutase [Aulographum hederae CBS 113979]
MKRTFKYTTITGFFEHDEPAPTPNFRATTSPNLGLIIRPYPTDAQFDPSGEKTQWQRFEHYIQHLNRNVENSSTQYKLLYLARHGQGFHNVMESSVGTAEWERHWARLPGNSSMTWEDAKLTDVGIGQAKALNVFWRDAFGMGIPAPEKYYTSPHARCMETARLTFSGLELPEEKPFRPLIKELMRERMGVHTCDRRSSLSWIREAYPEYEVEEGFVENDELWMPEHRETAEELDVRIKTLLDDVFAREGKTFISFTGHSGTIQALYRVVGHRDVGVDTGTLVPLFLKVEVENK